MIALTTTSIAWLLFAVIVGGWVVYAFLNLRQSRDELGSEQEMAANRKKYYDDEILEGPRLTRVLGIGVVLLVVIVIGVAAVLDPRAVAAWPAPPRPRRRSSSNGDRDCSPRPLTVASTAPAATAG